MTPAELAELDLAVARAEGVPDGDSRIVHGALSPWCEIRADRASRGYYAPERYQPTRDGAEAMRLLEKYRLDVQCKRPDGSVWTAISYDEGRDEVLDHDGPTPAIAICRAVVALKGKA